MAVLRIHTVPGDEAFLRTTCTPVTQFGPELKTLAADMLETLPTLGGIGLAAPQVGHGVRMVLVDLSDAGDEENPGPAPFFLVNPVIKAGDGEACLAEGCLSVPGMRVEVPRKARIDVVAQDLDGKPLAFEATDLLAIVIQHELDHLDGRLIVDYAKMGYPTFREDEVPAGRQILD